MTQVIPRIDYYKKDKNKQTSAQWWKDPTDKHTNAVASCRAIEDRQIYRRRRNVLHARMYGNQFLQQFHTNIYTSSRTIASQELRVTLNVAKSCVDTAASKIAKNRPRPLFLTTRGTDNQKLRAKKLTQYVDGVFHDAKVYPTTQLSFRDAGIFGNGFVKILADEEAGRIKVERVLPDEIVVEDNESIYGAPRTMYHRRFMDRALVMALWGSSEDESRKAVADKIRTATGGGGMMRPDMTDQSDMLYVVEAWHLPSSQAAGDGAHVICINDATLFEEKYEKDYFPIVPFYWTRPIVGFYGAGIIEEIAGLQLEINKLLRDIQLGQHRVCNPQIWIENSTHIIKPITNEIGSINRYTGKPPVFYAPSAFSSEIYNHVWNIYKRAFEIVGISELSATLKKPAGLESRAALREYNDIETERFALIGQDWERFHLEISDIIIDMSADLFAKNKKLSVNVIGKKFIETISWKDVDMDRDQYVMTNWPSSLLPNTPSGRLDKVQDMIDGGLVDTEEAKSLLDFPDLESVMSLETASRDCITHMLDLITEKGEYTSPEQFMNLDEALRMAQYTYLRGITEDLEEDKLELLNRFMKQILELKGQMQKTAETTAAVGPPGLPKPGEIEQASQPPQPPIGPNGGGPPPIQ